MNKIKTGDKVKVLRGKDAGMTGEVLKIVKPVDERKGYRVVVRGVNMVKIHQKPNPTFNLPGGIIETEKPISISNVMLLDGDKPTRVKIDNSDKKNKRVSVKTGKEIK